MSYTTEAPQQAPVTPNVTMTAGTHPFSIVCPRFDCYYRTAHASLDLAEVAWDEHLKYCPIEGKSNEFLTERDERGQRYTMLRVSKSILEKLWDDLDAEYDRYLENSPTMSGELSRGLMRGIAIAIQKMSVHYFPTVDGVVQEELKRQAIRSGQREFEPTPGYRYNPPPIGTAAYEKANRQAVVEEPLAAAPKRTARKTATAAKSKPELLPNVSDEVKTKIVNAIKMDLFTDEDLSISFKVPVTYIKSLRNSIDS